MPRRRRPLQPGPHRGPILRAILRRSSHTPAWCLTLETQDEQGHRAKLYQYWKPGDPITGRIAAALGLGSVDHFEELAASLPELVGREIAFHRSPSGAASLILTEEEAAHG